MTVVRRLLGPVLALALVLAACSSAEDGADGDAGSDAPSGTGRVTIGLLNPLTGPFAALGEDVNDGVSLYVDERGGALAGYEVELIDEDTANDAAVATEGAQRLVEQGGADVLVGLVNSGVAYGASSYIRESGVPLVITTAGADGLTQADAAPSVFRVSYTSSQDAMPLAAYACDELGHERVAVVGLDYAFGWEAAGGFSRAFTDAGCTVAQELYAPLGTQDWGPVVGQIDDGVDAVWAVIAGADATRFLQAYRDFRIGLPLLGHGALTDEQVLADQQELAQGVITSLHYSSVLESEANMVFRDSFEEAFGRPVSQYVENGYAAAAVLEAALEAAGETGPDALTEALRDVDVTAPRGRIRFDEYQQAVYPVYIRRVEQVEGEGWSNVVIETIEDVSQFGTYAAEEWLDLTPLAETKGTWAR